MAQLLSGETCLPAKYHCIPPHVLLITRAGWVLCRFPRADLVFSVASQTCLVVYQSHWSTPSTHWSQRLPLQSQQAMGWHSWQIWFHVGHFSVAGFTDLQGDKISSTLQIGIYGRETGLLHGLQVKYKCNIFYISVFNRNTLFRRQKMSLELVTHPNWYLEKSKATKCFSWNSLQLLFLFVFFTMKR